MIRFLAWAGAFCIVMLFLFVMFDREEKHSSQGVVVTETAAPIPSSPIPYNVVKEWASGTSRVIVIDPKYRNEPDLRKLGKALVDEARNIPLFTVEVFDDYGAADSRQEAMAQFNSNSALVVHYKRHYIAKFTKHAGTGAGELYITIDEDFDNDSKIIKVAY